MFRSKRDHHIFCGGFPFHPRQKEPIRRLFISVAACVTAYWLTRPTSPSSPSAELTTRLLDPQIRMQREWASHGIISNTSWSLGFFLKSGHPSELSPHVIWLATYKGSGEDYLTSAIQRVSDYNMATNDGPKVTNQYARHSLSIYPRHEEGPYWEGIIYPEFGDGKKARTLPPKYVVTLTHCGSGPDPTNTRRVSEHVEPFQQGFVDTCRNATAQIIVDGTDERQFLSYLYPLHYVHKIIHVIRNPLHNIVQTFNQEIEYAKNRQDDKWLKTYPQLPVEGFQKYCKFQNDKHLRKPQKLLDDWGLSSSMSLDTDVAQRFLDFARKAPCFKEFYNYVVWHNHLFDIQLTPASSDANDLSEPLVVYYEQFHMHLEESIHKILDYAELPLKEDPKGFPKPHPYNRYYQEDSMLAIRNWVKVSASKTTWQHLQHYF